MTKNAPKRTKTPESVRKRPETSETSKTLNIFSHHHRYSRQSMSLPPPAQRPKASLHKLLVPMPDQTTFRATSPLKLRTAAEMDSAPAASERGAHARGRVEINAG